AEAGAPASGRRQAAALPGGKADRPGRAGGRGGARAEQPPRRDHGIRAAPARPRPCPRGSQAPGDGARRGGEDGTDRQEPPDLRAQAPAREALPGPERYYREDPRAEVVPLPSQPDSSRDGSRPRSADDHARLPPDPAGPDQPVLQRRAGDGREREGGRPEAADAS